MRSWRRCRVLNDGKYFGPLGSALDHFFGNVPLIIRVYAELGTSLSALERERDFATRILNERIIEGIPNYKNVTNKSVLELLEISSGDLGDVEVLKKIYVKYFEIKGEEPSFAMLSVLDEL